jgi:hypothetical protein
MIETVIGDYPERISDDQVQFVDQESFLNFGKVLTDDETIEGRFAYSRVWLANPLSKEACSSDGIPGHPSMTMEKFLHEEAFARIIGNDHVLKIAAAVLDTPPEDLVYVSGYIHRQLLARQWEYSDWFWDGWHTDAQPSMDPLTHCNLWIYFNDCTREEGVTQALKGSVPLMRENLRAGKPIKDRWEEGGTADGIQALIEEVGDNPDKGTWAQAPAGGGFAWGGGLWHRIAPNRSGINRQLVTYEYEPRDNIQKDDWKTKTTAEQRASIIEMLPPEKRYLLEY